MPTATKDTNALKAAAAEAPAKPGYKHTKLGWIPEEWEVSPLNKTVHKSRHITYGIVKPGEHDESGVFMIRSQDYANGWASMDSIMRVAPKIEKPYQRSRIKAGDILITVVGANLGRMAVVPDELDGANISRAAARIGVDPERAHSKYVEQVLQSGGVDRLIQLSQIGGAQPVLNLKELGELTIAIPPLPEQRRIAAVLGAWDRAIATVQQLLAAQQERKRGLMQELLTGRRRFTGFGGKWKECELGELGQFRTSSVDKKLVDGQQRVRLVNYMDVYNNQRIYSGMPLMEVTAKDSQLHSSSLRRGDILFTPSSETPDDIGHSAVVVEDMVNTLFSYHVMRFRPHDDTLVLDFRAYVFNNESILKQFSAKATGSTRYTLSASDFGDTLVSFPTDKSEQQAIARTLMACDSEIESMTNQLNHLTTQKRGLMQQLLTGAVRVKV